MRISILVAGVLFALGGCSKKLPSYDDATGGNPQRGQDAIARYGCGACHRIDGVANAYGLVGPSLREIGERSYVAGNLPNSPGNLELWIRHPRQVDAHTAMPELGVTQTDARDIVAYLYNQ